MTMLAAVAHPLVCEKAWLGGQKHVLSLLELCVPGIDLVSRRTSAHFPYFESTPDLNTQNDPIKTLCAAMFIASTVQYVKIGDLSALQAGIPFTGDAPAEEMMRIETVNESGFPDGSVSDAAGLSREEERTCARDSTAGFTDWVVSLFRRVFALYENLPEEGGKRNTTGGKMEEGVLKAIKSMLDVVCLNLSDPLFDLVLKLVYDYATTNAKSNAVRAFGQLVSCLARVQPEKTIAKFLPFCAAQIQEELKHGASSIRTTSMHAPVPSDTTLHWNISILRGCLGYGGACLIKYKPQLLELVLLLIEKTKSERGYTSTGRLINRILYTLTSIYPINSRFVDADEWNNPDFDQDHIAHWGRLYEPHDVKIEWHVPTDDEIHFVMEILDKVAAPALDMIEASIGTADRWDNIARNDFCRSIWSGLPTLFKEGPKDVVNPCLDHNTEVSELLVSPMDVNCGFLLTDPTDPRYQKVANHRTRFGQVIHRAALVLRESSQGEDHIDAVVAVAKAIDVYLLEYAVTRSSFDSLRKAYAQAREALDKGVDPDRMKGALYVLWNKGTAAYALADVSLHGHYLLSLLQCQHQEKPSIQKLVGNLVQDALVYLTEEAVHTDAFIEDAPGVKSALEELKKEYVPSRDSTLLLSEASGKMTARAESKNQHYAQTMLAIIGVASRSTTHWRYKEFALKIMFGLLRRDVSISADAAQCFLRLSISPHPTIRTVAQKAVSRLTCHIKIRSYAQSTEQLWLDEWTSPLQRTVAVIDPARLLRSLEQPIDRRDTDEKVYVDKISTGFVMWSSTVKGYRVVREDELPLSWESASTPVLGSMSAVLREDGFFPSLAALWSQESSKQNTAPVLRADNIVFMKSLAKMFGNEHIEAMLSAIDALILDGDRFKQRAGAEMLAGLLRGSKHWPRSWSDNLWAWLTAHLKQIYGNMKPDTISYWEGMFSEQLVDRDPRRAQLIVEWILSLPLDFHSDSAFATLKSLSLLNVLIDCLDLRFHSLSDKYMNLFLENANTGYAEARIRAQIAQNLHAILISQWRPTYLNAGALLTACVSTSDPLQIRSAKYMTRVVKIIQKLPSWREERFPPPRVSQSQYDKVGLTLLQWIWECSHGPQATLILPYAITLLPEVLRMSELNDSSELQKYSSAVLYILSAVTPPAEYIEVIADNYIKAIKSSTSWRVRIKALPTLLVFYYRNLMSISDSVLSRLMDVLLECLADENVEVREMASKMLSGVVRSSQRQNIVPLMNRFLSLARRTPLPARGSSTYVDALRILHSAILGLCALIESLPYSVESWMPPLTDVLAVHATDPAPISTTIRKCASEFKKTHQDTWHKDQLAFDEDQLQNLATMLVGTSYFTNPLSTQTSFFSRNTGDAISPSQPKSHISLGPREMLPSSRRAPNGRTPKAELSERSVLSPANGGFHWMFNGNGQLVDPAAGNWDLADDMTKMHLGVGDEASDPHMHTPPHSRSNASLLQLQSSSPLETASEDSIDSGSSNALDHPTNHMSHSRESSADTHASALSSTSQTLRAAPLTPLKVGAVGESRNRPHSYSGGLSSTDLTRLQQAGGSPASKGESWVSPNGTPERQQQIDQPTYPSLAAAGRSQEHGQASQVDMDNAQAMQLRQFSPVPQGPTGAPAFLPGRPNNVAGNMQYRQAPRGYNPSVPPVLQSPTGFGYPPAPPPPMALSTPQQQLYEMMLPTPPLDNPTMARLQQQHGVFRGSHQHSASDPANVRDPATLALLNGNLQAFSAGQMYPPALGPPATLSMFANQFYPQEAYASPDLVTAQMMARLQSQYGAYGVPVPAQNVPVANAIAPNTTGGVTPTGSGGVGPSANNRKLGLYKTELCRSWEEKGTCRYSAKCQFAHGEEELRKVSRHPKYKTEICRTFWVSGSCPYGKRCCFIHTELPASGPPPGADGTPPPQIPHGRDRSGSTNSDPNEISSSLLARISAKRNHEGSMNPNTGNVSTTPPSSSFQLSGRPGALRVDTTVLDSAASAKQNKSAYPTFAHNGIMMPAGEEVSARSPGPVTAGPDFGRHAASRLDIVGTQQRAGKSSAANPGVRHSFNGSDIQLDFNTTPTATNVPTQLATPSDAPKSSARINGHVRSGSAGNWGSATRNLTAYPLSSIPGGELNKNSPWADYSTRRTEKNWV
ncbi:uncharacterized protein FIBRA_03696 [Fibroporia radiculosa]|uniref:C3H1-type domain-containing protein n=1 Tax=Fibroporia radiculosa TaxID=599839 RepID=J4GNM2_9APHY|nr:uncharacterized protein FIBRA_03696 [Fibroporia radiculosa]CCM01635.1 predicted protein [Fibroporia radiculosa]